MRRVKPRRRATAAAGGVVAKLASGNPKTAALAIGVADALAKNGEGVVHVALAEAGLAAALCRVAVRDKGRSGGSAALALLHELGTAYGAAAAPPLSAFPAALAEARAAGCSVAAAAEGGVEAKAMARLAASAGPAAGRSGEAAAPGRGAQTPERLVEQLAMVASWVGDAARHLRAEGGGSAAAVRGAARETLLDHVDVLEQCEERLLTLIEAGMGGRLGDDACLGGALEAQAAVAEILPWLRGDAAPAAGRLDALCGEAGRPQPSAAAAAAVPSAAVPAAATAASAAGSDELDGLFGGPPAAAVPPASTAAPAGSGVAASSSFDPFASDAAADTSAPAMAAADSAGSFDPRSGEAAAARNNAEAEELAPAAAAAAATTAAGGDDDGFDPRGAEAAKPTDEDDGFDPRSAAAEPAAAEPAPAGDLADFEAFLDEQSGSGQP